MKLHHIAFWTYDIEILVDFYQKYFNAHILFSHQSEDFRCTFIECNEIKIEIMTRPVLSEREKDGIGYSHLSFEVKSKDEVNRLTDYFINQKVQMEKVKEQYDDGFYESSIIDPDGNVIELAYIDRTINSSV